MNNSELIELGKLHKNSLHPWGIGTTKEDYLRAAYKVRKHTIAECRDMFVRGSVSWELLNDKLSAESAEETK